MTLYDLIILLLALIPAVIIVIKEWNLIRKTYDKIKFLFKFYILWSKEDRIRAMEIRKKYQLPEGMWVKDENDIKVVNTIRRRTH